MTQKNPLKYKNWDHNDSSLNSSSSGITSSIVQQQRIVEEEIKSSADYLLSKKWEWEYSPDLKSIQFNIEDIKNRVEKYETLVTELYNEVSDLKRYIREMRGNELMIKNTNQIEEANKFRASFGLPPLNDNFEMISFKDLEGILNELSQEGIDSVELIKSIRGR